MACFIVPVSEAIVTTIAGKIVKKHEDNTPMKECDSKIPFSKKLNVLNEMEVRGCLPLNIYGMVKLCRGFLF